MNDTILLPKHDAMGAAIKEYYATGRASRLNVLSEMFDDDEIPVPYLFRSFDEMPPLEQQALAYCCGSVLDVGAGAGCHALALQERGVDVTALDISPLSCEVMRERGIRQVVCQNVMAPNFQGNFDTLLLLMNGIGMAGTIEALPDLLGKLKQLLAPGGQILTDSCDLHYIFENEDGSMDIDLTAHYYGEVDYRMTYRQVDGEPFNWVYIDFPLLTSIAQGCGMKATLLAEGDSHDYLARLESE